MNGCDGVDLVGRRFPWTPRGHPKAAVIEFASGMNLVVHEPDFARLWDPAYAGPAAGSTVVDVNVRTPSSAVRMDTESA